MSAQTRHLADDAATQAFGAGLYQDLINRWGGNAVVFLHGELGAGKTTLVRGLLDAAGHSGNVKSPTYTLLEPYQTDKGDVFHFDLYRLKSPEELEFLGFDEIFEGPGFKFVEWPAQGAGWLPPANVEVSLSLHAPNQTAEEPADSVAPVQRKVSVRFA